MKGISKSIARIKTGSYTGDDAPARTITGLGFKPSVVVLYEHISLSSDKPYIKCDQDGLYTKDTGGGYFSNYIVSLDDDGFTLGTSTAEVNQLAQVYSFIAIKESP